MDATGTQGFAPRWGTPLSRMLGRAALRLFGWRLDVNLPPEPRLVIVAAPHTSNWDGFLPSPRSWRSACA